MLPVRNLLLNLTNPFSTSLQLP